MSRRFICIRYCMYVRLLLSYHDYRGGWVRAVIDLLSALRASGGFRISYFVFRIFILLDGGLLICTLQILLYL